MLSYSKQSITKKDIKTVINALKSDYITQGKKIGEFERKLANYFGAKKCVLVSNATMALYLISKALRWGKEDNIICSPISFVSASNAALINGAKPHFCEINYETGNICTKSIEKKIIKLRKKRKKITAIIVVDYGGLPADWKEIRRIGKKYNTLLINDNCHAMGASYQGSKKYAVKYADLVVQSYHAVKNITTGEGGSILSNNSKIIDKIKSLRTHGIIKNDKKSLWHYQMVDLGYNARITDFQCALGMSQLSRLNKIVKKKEYLAKVYNEHFSKYDIIDTPQKYLDRKSALHLYPLKINFSKLKITKKKFFHLCKNKQIKLQVHYIPIYKHPYYLRNYKYNLNDFKNCENFYNSVISLPIYYDLKKSDVIYIIKNIKKIINKYEFKQN